MIKLMSCQCYWRTHNFSYRKWQISKWNWRDRWL